MYVCMYVYIYIIYINTNTHAQTRTPTRTQTQAHRLTWQYLQCFGACLLMIPHVFVGCGKIVMYMYASMHTTHTHTYIHTSLLGVICFISPHVYRQYHARLCVLVCCISCNKQNNQRWNIVFWSIIKDILLQHKKQSRASQYAEVCILRAWRHTHIQKHIHMQYAQVCILRVHTHTHTHTHTRAQT